ncbi:S41 family peptidase [Brevundimonas vesicularis]|uniref:S41 family peptidase n=1 Tax=Brevundimonas vesicularis TaxID=41276 RepID=UPI0022EC3DDD|nr:S41 family peptidase [Brevundimonas vesicularis]WBT05812.1 S41 family peptidase [Brevundimonas vesicularis]
MSETGDWRQMMVMRLSVSARLFSLLLLGLPLSVPAVAQPVDSPVVDPVVATAPSRDRARLNQRVFDRVWSEVRRGYYDPTLQGVDWNAARATFRPQALAASDERGLYRVINAMLDLLDDGHAAASPPAAVRRQEAQFARRAVMGLTLMRGETPDDWTVERVRPGSPAEAAGVQMGWALNSVDGKPWGPDVESYDGVPVQLVLTDDAGQRREIALTPRVMEAIKPFTADKSRPGVLVLRVEQFDKGLGAWMGSELEGLPPDIDVVLDLRGNPGGRLMEAESVLTCFLPRDQVWATRTGRSGRPVVLRAAGDCGDRRDPLANDVAVLVDQGSRSAAELTPAALQEARRGIVLGEKTGGSVLIAQETNLPDGGRLTLSRADFVTSGGIRLEKRGVTPDIAAPRTVAQRRAGDDPTLEAAIAALRAEERARASTPASGL